MNRDEAIKEIKRALEKRSGKQWSVTGGRGTGWGWIKIDAPPARRTWGCRLKAGAVAGRPEDYEEYDTGKTPGHMSPADRAELGELLANGGPVHMQGVNVPSSSAHYREYIARANGQPFQVAEAYWD